jgi:hypothetical protein
MNEEKIQKEIKGINNIRLSKNQKETMREAVLLHVKNNPVVKKEMIESFWFFKANFVYKLAVILIVITGTVSFASERSLPGDMLYSVKIAGENIREALILNEEAKIDYKVIQVARRLEEAEKLSIAGRLDEAMSAKIEDNFERISNDTITRLSVMAEKEEINKESITANFEARLRVYENSAMFAVGTSTLPLKVQSVLFRLEDVDRRYKEKRDQRRNSDNEDIFQDKPIEIGRIAKLEHEFEEGVHKIKGLVEMPSACHSLEIEARVAESYPEQVSIVFTSQSDAEVCILILEQREFEIEFNASDKASIKFIWNEQPMVVDFALE